jgi:type VII secretion protein EccB
MASRQDQWHSHQLMMQRLVSALVCQDSEPDGPPVHTGAATLAGVLVAAIALGAVAAWGAFTSAPATGDWRRADVLVVVEESGARYVWRDGALHPVGSYTSAQLVLGEPAPRTVTVPWAALDGAPRGAPLGIPGAPESLPPGDRLVSGHWTICSQTGGDRGDGGAGPVSVLVAGAGPVLGTDPAGQSVPDGAGLLVEATGGERYLIWQQRRHRVRDEQTTLPALGWAGRTPVPVADTWLAALPAAADLARIPVPGLGAPSAAVPGAVVGEVFVVAGRSGAPQYAIALADGLAPMTAVQVDLVLTDPVTAAVLGQQQPREMTQARFAALPRLDAAALPGAGLPPVAPPLVTPAGDRATVCATVPDDTGVSGLRLDVPLPPMARTVRTAGHTGDGEPLADHVMVAPGRGVLVSTGDTVGIVTDQGVHHPIPPHALAALGYAVVTPVPMPLALVSLLPSGAELDPEAAGTPRDPG